MNEWIKLNQLIKLNEWIHNGKGTVLETSKGSQIFTYHKLVTRTPCCQNKTNCKKYCSNYNVSTQIYYNWISLFNYYKEGVVSNWSNNSRKVLRKNGRFQTRSDLLHCWQCRVHVLRLVSPKIGTEKHAGKQFI